MFDNRVKELVLATLVADAYCLGSHWIYDEKQLKDLNIDWQNLSKACSVWHKGKQAGEFTHYGDQNYYLYKFLENKENFDQHEYIEYWASKMRIYDGYIDGATRETLQNLDEKKEVPCGSTSHDLSIIGRIPALLKVSSSKESFFENIEKLVCLTHNNDAVIEASKFFGKVLVDVLEGKEIIESIEAQKERFSRNIQEWVDKGLASKNSVTFDTIREFGPACGVDEGFAGVIHILSKYNTFKDAMIENAKAGGDNSARAMIIAMLLTAKEGVQKIPAQWSLIKVQV